MMRIGAGVVIIVRICTGRGVRAQQHVAPLRRPCPGNRRCRASRAPDASRGMLSAGEIVPVVLDLRAGRDREAQVGEDLASSSITWLTGWMLPCGTASAGSVMSTRSAARRASSAAPSSAALRAAIASVTASRRSWISGPWLWRSSGVIAPSVLSRPVTTPLLPSAPTRRASTASAGLRQRCRPAGRS